MNPFTVEQNLVFKFELNLKIFKFGIESEMVYHTNEVPNDGNLNSTSKPGKIDQINKGRQVIKKPATFSSQHVLFNYFQPNQILLA